MIPLKFKTKARYMNVSEQIRWGQSVCSLLQRSRANNLSPQQQAELPAELLDKKLGWLESFADVLVVWWELIDVGEGVCRLVRSRGYRHGMGEQLAAALPAATTASGQQLRSQLIDFVRGECGKLPRDASSPGSSEVTESLIGKGKRLEGQQSHSGFTRYILGIAASVVIPTAELLQSVSETVGIKHISQWLAKHLPASVQAKRIRDLGRRKKEQKQDNSLSCATPTF